MRIIATEEHFLTEDYLNHLRTRKGIPRHEIEKTETGTIERIFNTPFGQSISHGPARAGRELAAPVQSPSGVELAGAGAKDRGLPAGLRPGTPCLHATRS